MKSLVLIIIIFSTNISYSQKYDNEVKDWPIIFGHKHHNFKLKKKNFVLKDTTIVDTSCVYISKYHVWEDSTNRVSYTRFFSNGRVFKSGDYLSLPTESEFNNLDYGRRGYYYIDEDGYVVMEFYVNVEDGYVLSWVKKEDDMLVSYKTKKRWFLSGFKPSFGVRKKHKTKLYSKPCW